MVEVSKPVSTAHITQNQSNPTTVKAQKGKILPIVMIAIGILLATLCTIIGVISGVPLICITALAGVIPIVFGVLELIKLQRQKPEEIPGREPSEKDIPSIDTSHEDIPGIDTSEIKPVSTPSQKNVAEKTTPSRITIPEFNWQSTHDFFVKHFNRDVSPITTVRPAKMTRCGDLTVTFAVQPIQFAIPQIIGHNKSAVFNSVNVDVVPGRSGVNRILSKCVSRKCWDETRPVEEMPEGTLSYTQMHPGELTAAKWESSRDFKNQGHPSWNLLMQLRATPSRDYSPEEAFPILVGLYLGAFSKAWDHNKNPAGVSCTYCQTSLLGAGAYSPKLRDPASREAWSSMVELAFLTAVQKFSCTRQNDGSMPRGNIVLVDEKSLPMEDFFLS